MAGRGWAFVSVSGPAISQVSGGHGWLSPLTLRLTRPARCDGAAPGVQEVKDACLRFYCLASVCGLLFQWPCDTRWRFCFRTPLVLTLIV